VRLHVRVLQLLLLLHVLRVILLLRVGRQEMLLVVLLRIWEIDGLLRLLLGREDASRCTVGCVWCSDCMQERRAGDGQQLGIFDRFARPFWHGAIAIIQVDVRCREELHGRCGPAATSSRRRMAAHLR
jgi:hypothetical protein